MKNIVLIGFMGAGKSTAAAILGKKIGYRIFDLDTLIEQAAGKTIPNIFRDAGEDGFRALESKVLTSIDFAYPFVLATGGGVVIQAENWAAMRDAGCIVYLRARWETLRNRLEGNTNRPLVNQARDWSDVCSLFEQRISLYEKADMIIDTDGRSVENIVDEIIARCKDRLLC